MNLLVVLDFSWKLLFFITIFTTIYFSFLIASTSFFTLISSSKKMQIIKSTQIFLLTSIFVISIFLFFSDQDLVANCFEKFAHQEGVFGVTRSMTGIWLIGVLIFIVKDAVSYFFLKNKINCAILRARSLKLLNNSAVTNPVHFYEVNNTVDPVVVGITRMKIFIPSSVVENESSLQHVLAHELIHQQNKDGIWNLVSHFIHRINWFNPLSYWAMSKIKLHLEMATDEQAVSIFKLNIVDYANNLVSLVTKNKSIYAMCASGDFLQIKSRLFYLKKIQSGNMRPQSIYTFVMSMSLIFGLSQALAAIKQPSNELSVRMCFQVKHELLLESWIMTGNRSEPNKCEQ